MERNRRVAKAYARAPILTINGTDDGFDGYRIGLNGFDNPLRDQKTDIIKHHIGDVSITTKKNENKNHPIFYSTTKKNQTEYGHHHHQSF